MRQENAIEVRGVRKKFKIYYDKSSSLKERVLFRNRSRYEEKWILKEINFEIKKGEAIGLIGSNGCGKSTILKMLARILYPTEGTIEMKGRVSSLIELGAGFHPDMSGRENIFTNASIFGLNRTQIQNRLDDIIKFSELEEFIDNPVRTYSSGMYMRLAFSVAIHVDADILLIDEILAVGDVNFQKKCFERLRTLKKEGVTIVIVSHVMEQIRNICSRAIFIEDGCIYKEGKAAEIADLYMNKMEQKQLEKIERDFQDEIAKRKNNILEHRPDLPGMLPEFCCKGAKREGSLEIYFTNAVILNAHGKQTMFFQIGEPMEICMYYHARKLNEKINFIINISRDDGMYCFGTSALSGAHAQAKIESQKNGKAKMVIESNNLLKGRYLVDIGIQDMQEYKYDYIYNAMEFRVEDKSSKAAGIVYLPGYWET